MTTDVHPGSWRSVAAALDRKAAESLGAMQLVAAASAFLISLLMSKLGGPTTRGQLALVLQVAYILWPLATLGLDRMLLRNSSGVRRAPGYLHLPISGMVALGAYAFGAPLIVAAAIGATTLWGAHFALLRADSLARRHVTRYLVIAATYQAWLVAGAITIWVLGATGAGPWLLLYSAPGLAAALAAVHPRAASSRPGLRGQVAEARASFPLGVSHTLGAIGFRSDRLIMPAVMGVAPLGVYLSAATPLELVAGFSIQRADARVSRITGATGFAPTVPLVLRAAGREGLTFGPAILAVAGLTEYVVLPWLGPEFEEGSAVIPWMALASLLLVLYRTANAFNLGSHLPRAAALPEAFAGALSVPIYWVAITKSGIVGAAVGSCAVYAIAFMAAIVVFARNRHILRHAD